MNPKITPREALRKVDALIKKNTELLQRSYPDGSEEKSRLNTRIEGFIRTTFTDDNEKLDDYHYYLNSSHIGSPNFEMNDEMLQEDYIRELKVMSNHLLAYKEEIELIIASDRNNFEKFLGLLKKNQIYKSLALLIPFGIFNNAIKSNFPNYGNVFHYINIGLICIIVFLLLYYILLLAFEKD